MMRPSRRRVRMPVFLCALVGLLFFLRPQEARSSEREAAATRPGVDSAAHSSPSHPHAVKHLKRDSPAMAKPAKSSAKPDSLRISAAQSKAGAQPSSSGATAKTPSDSLAPLRDVHQKALQAPEKLLFDIVWGGWNFRWIHAGQATLELLPGDKPDLWQIRSLAWCNSFFQTFYPVRDTVTSLIDARGIYPLRFEKRLHEGSYQADISAVYDQARHRLRTQDTTLAIEPFTHDVLSAFYFIRTQNLRVGDSFELEAVSGKKKYKLKVLCHGRESISVPAGEFQTLVVEPVLVDDGLFKAKGKLTIWITDDAAHIPVKMQSKIPVGSIKAELVALPRQSP